MQNLCHHNSTKNPNPGLALLSSVTPENGDDTLTEARKVSTFSLECGSFI